MKHYDVTEIGENAYVTEFNTDKRTKVYQWDNNQSKFVCKGNALIKRLKELANKVKRDDFAFCATLSQDELETYLQGKPVNADKWLCVGLCKDNFVRIVTSS